MNNKLGTYTTFDCPTEKIDEAYEFLKKEFEKINGVVRKVINDHDLGFYPSFEIDYPKKLENIDEDAEYEDLDNEEIEIMEEKNDWITEANIIETAYYSKFGKYL